LEARFALERSIKTTHSTTSEQRSTGEWCKKLIFWEAAKAPCYHGQTFSLTESPAHKLFAGLQAWELVVSSKASQMRFR
jgi:hypothetical protein